MDSPLLKSDMIFSRFFTIGWIPIKNLESVILPNLYQTISKIFKDIFIELTFFNIFLN
jgi:hypothetical protein